MGGTLSSYLTDIALYYFDCFINTQCQIFNFTRYVDDCFNFVYPQDLEAVMNTYNDYHPSLQFTFEHHNNNSLSFLDLEISFTENQTEYSHYTKPCQTTRVIPFDTHSPTNVKLSALKNEIRRTYENNSNTNNFVLAIPKIKSKYYHCGFPLPILDKICTLQWAQSPRKQYQPCQYNAFLPYLGPISDQLSHLLQQYNIRIISTPTPTILNHVTPLQNKPCKPLPLAYVYALPCSGCSSIYIGQTSRGQQRLSEHLRDIKNKKISSAPYLHSKKTLHEIDTFHYTPIAHEQHYFSRLNLETFYILLHQPATINIQIPEHFAIKSWIKFVKKIKPDFEQYSQSKLKKQLIRRTFQI